ncbi:MAG: GNAT family N-acetyltransferase [Flavitalea sp.]
MNFIIEKVSPEIVWPVRHKVMYPDMDFESIKLEEDAGGIHLALFGVTEYNHGIPHQNENEADKTLISVVSLFRNSDDLQFRKFATMNEYQGKGYGSALLKYIIEFAKDIQVKRIWCNARKNASDFYKREGFKETNESFFKDGYDFVIMELLIK